MSSIIQPVKDSVNSKLDSAVLSKKEPKIEKLVNLRILFIGTPEFGVPVLEEMINSDFRPIAVITAPDKPAGRGQEITPPPIKTTAKKYLIQVFQPETIPELVDAASKTKPDIIVVAAYGKILPKEVLALPKYGSLNVHPSLLPKYRGPSPIQSAILTGDEKTGVTIMLMNEKMDAGPILSQETIAINETDTGQTLEEKLSQLGAELLVKTLIKWVIIKEMPDQVEQLIYPQEQDEREASYTKILTKQDGKIIWDKSAKEIERQIRAFYPWPGSFIFFKPNEDSNEKPLSLKILKAGLLPLQTQNDMGKVFLTENNELAVQTGKNCLIIKELQLEGNKPMIAIDFLNGHQEIIGALLR